MTVPSSESTNHLDNSRPPTSRMKRLLLYAALVTCIFLLGFIPTCVVARRRGIERDTAQAALRISNLQNSLANAMIDAGRGEYEVARQTTSEFFTNLGTELERGRDSIFNPEQEKSLRSLLEERDATITALARSDAGSVDRLAKLYDKYRQAMRAAPPAQ